MKHIENKKDLYNFIEQFLQEKEYPFQFKDMCNLALQKYKEEWRYYHNEDHLIDLYNEFLSFPVMKKNDDVKLFLLILFHDVEYKPWRFDNEEKSIEFFENSIKQLPSSLRNEEIETFVKDGIEQSKNHDMEGHLISAFNDWDYFSVIYQSNPLKLFNWERKIFKEFQFVPVNTYIHKRIDFLRNANTQACNYLIDYLKNEFKPKVGYFAGSFNPFHIGHLSILQQAENVYDKVVIAIGENENKEEEHLWINKRKNDIFCKVPGREVTSFNGFLTDFVSKREREEETFLIRGIRNSKDWDYESNMLQYLKHLWSDVKVNYFACPKEIEHVSSSGIKALQKHDKNRSLSFIPRNIIYENNENILFK